MLGTITMIINSWHADKTGERFFHIAIPLSLAVVTFIISAATTNVAARYTAMMLMVRPFIPSTNSSNTFIDLGHLQRIHRGTSLD